MAGLHHEEPDGDRFLPHHHYHGMVIALISGFFVTPDAVGAASMFIAALATASFAWFWKPGTAVAAAGATVYLTVILAAVGAITLVAYGWALPPALVILGALVALDDSLQHATGWWMPLDWFWKRFLRGHIPFWPWFSDGDP